MKEQASEGVAQFLTALGIDLKAADMEKTPQRVAGYMKSCLPA